MVATLTIEIADDAITKLCERLAGLTDDNLHTDARIEIAKRFWMDKYRVELERINDRHMASGSISGADIHTRDEITRSMLMSIADTNGEAMADHIRRCL